MNKDRIIELLRLDMQLEHGAIIQYLTHAYAFGEGELACELEAIAREEMQHFRWLGEKVVDLGGSPSMERGPVTFGGPSIAGMLQADIDAETHGMSIYEQQAREIDDPDVVVLLNRILADERAHRDKFGKYQAEQDPEATVRMESTAAEEDRQTAEMMQVDLTHEYTVVLQYLAHAFLTPHCEVEHELEWESVEEMRHMGWLAEDMEGLGVRPEMTHTELDIPAATADMLKANIDIEQTVADQYRQHANLTEDGEAKKLFERIAAEEDHHVRVFSELLALVREEPSEPTKEAPGSIPEQPEDEDKPVATLPEDEPAMGPRPRLTVGSLLNEKQW